MEYPDFNEIEEAQSEGKIRSYEIRAVIKTLTNSMRNTVSQKISNLQHTINLYRYKSKISVDHVKSNLYYKNFPLLKDKISLEFKVQFLERREILSFIKYWFFEELSGSRSFSALFTYKRIDFNEFQESFYIELTKKPIREVSNFVTLDTKDKIFELFSQPIYMKHIFTYIFPIEGLTPEITIDVLHSDLEPQKRRIIDYKGSRIKFHDIINPNMTHEDFFNIIKSNFISAIYPSVRSTSPSQDVLYFVIDIDVSDFIKNNFKPQIVWDITMEITKELQRTISKLGLPQPSVKMSGSRGLHLILAIERDAIDNIEGKVNLTKLYIYESQIPGYSHRKKNKNSCIHDKFKMVKRIIQAICIKTIYDEQFDIPKEIRNRLGIAHPHNLIKLSKESNNIFPILLDTSIMGKGVFRIGGVHPSTGLVPIPLYDTESREFIPECSDFSQLKLKAAVDSVVAQMKEGEIKIYLQKPNLITRQQLQDLFAPDSLLPYFCIILRFDTIEACQRSPYSFLFWKNFYKLRGFYNYIKDLVFNYEEHNLLPENVISHIANLSGRLGIGERNRVSELINQHIKLKLIEYSVFKERLESLFLLELFQKLLRKKYIIQNQSDLIALFSDEYEFKKFLKECENLFYIVSGELAEMILTKNLDRYSKVQTKTLIEFSQKIDNLIKVAQIELAKFHLEYPKDNRFIKHRERRLLMTIHLVSNIYFAMNDFLAEFFKDENI